MRLMLCVLTCLLTASVLAAEPINIRNRDESKLDPEQNEPWLAAVERLRALPRPGEVKNMHLTAGVPQIYDLNEAAKARLARVSRFCKIAGSPS